MGLFISKQLQENFKKQQQFQLEAQRLQMERQLQMQQLVQERMMAMQVARAKDIADNFMTFTILVGLFGITMSIQHKSPLYVVPIFPLSFISYYFYDTGYGNKLIRNRQYAEKLLAERPELVALPNGPITFDEIEQRRQKAKYEEPL